MLDLAGADTERECTERAMRGGVAVAAHHGHAREGAPLFGSDHVHDALAGVAHREFDDAELLGVLAQHFHLTSRDRILEGEVDVRRGDVVVLGGDGEVGTTDGATGESQTIERLWAGDLVHEV
ncbi:unannotated protein [freshwater metagenome]|uniref:Unannotated protein n=1 Tax=freshwater metagenome TaxID=449393 RepID=A0A6J7PSD3_9ZZZZ